MDNGSLENPCDHHKWRTIYTQKPHIVLDLDKVDGNVGADCNAAQMMQLIIFTYYTGDLGGKLGLAAWMIGGGFPTHFH